MAKKWKYTITTISVIVLVVMYLGLSVYAGTFLPIRIVQGDSMEPNLVSGDVILVKLVPFSTLAVGDIIMYKHKSSAESAEKVIIHRIVGIESSPSGYILITKGDNDTELLLITEDRFWRGHVARIPWIGNLGIW